MAILLSREKGYFVVELITFEKILMAQASMMIIHGDPNTAHANKGAI